MEEEVPDLVVTKSDDPILRLKQSKTKLISDDTGTNDNGNGNGNSHNNNNNNTKRGTYKIMVDTYEDYNDNSNNNPNIP